MPAALAAWAAAGLLTALEAPWSFGLAVVASSAAALAWRRPAVVLPCVGVAAVAVGCGVRIAAVDAAPLTSLADRGEVIEAVVTLREDARTYTGRAGRASVLSVTVHGVRSGDRAWRMRVHAVAFVDEVSPQLVAGARLVLRARAAPADSADEAAALRVTRWRLDDRGRWWWRSSEVVRQGVRGGVDHRGGQAAALVPALVAGDESGLSDRTRDEFSRAGLTHLLAVSGANLTIVLAVVLAAARAGGASTRVMVGLGLVTALAFVLVARPEPSVLRAAVMGSVALVALLTDGRRGGVRALGWAMMLLLLLDPWLAARAGFVLSVCATGGIILGAPLLARRLAWLPLPLAQALAVPLAAHLACLPVVAALSGEISLVAVVANVLAAPAVAPATVCGLAAGLLDLLVPPVAAVVGEVAIWSASVIVTVARAGAGLPGAAVRWPHPWWTLLLVVPAVGWVVWRLAARPALAIGLSIGLVLAMVRPPSPGWPPAGALVVACDVGQGDAFVLPTGRSEAIVIDVGQEPAAVDRCLRDLGVERIRLLLFTHADADHVDGWRGAVAGREIEVVAVGPSGGPEVAAARRVVLAAGDALAVAALRIEVLWPRAQRPVTVTAGRNDVSVVARITTASGRRLLFTGDLGEEAQRALARADPDLAADVLKVAHHGSADTWAGLTDLVRPRVALIGVGADNTFGHPAPQVVAGLTDHGTLVVRTDEDGTSAVVERDGRLAVLTRR